MIFGMNEVMTWVQFNNGAYNTIKGDIHEYHVGAVRTFSFFLRLSQSDLVASHVLPHVVIVILSCNDNVDLT